MKNIISRFLFSLIVFTATLFWLPAAMAQVSTYCPTQTLTVANGGSVNSIDLIACDGLLNLGMGGPFLPNLPANGTATLGSQTGPGNQFVTYVHNGSATTTDTFKLEDEDGALLTFNVTITAPASSIVVSPIALPTLKAGSPFSQSLSSTGGTAPYTYTLSTGALPLGVTLSSAGLLSGTPTQRGNYSFSVRSQDSVNAFVIKGYTGTVQNPTLSISPVAATAVQNVAFSQALTASGGVTPYSYLLETGAFPVGISISAAGVFSGTTAAAPSSFPVTVRVTDASTGPGSYFELENFTLTVSTATVPGAPTIGAATPGNGQASIAFTAPASNGGSAITGYTVTCNAGGILGTGAGSPLTVTGLTNGTTYSCSVVAANAVGNSAASASVAVTPVGAPGAPTIVAATPGNAQASIAFTAPSSNGGSAITGYTVTCHAGGFTATGPASPIAVTGLTNGTTYNCSVVATNAVGNSPASALLFVTPRTIPGAPTIGAATAGNAQAGIAFTAPTSNGGSAITSYTVTCSPGGVTGSAGASPITVTGLINGTTYGCAVTATNAAGTGPTSAAVAVTPATVPGAPTIGAATPGNGQASVAFTAPVSSGGSAITGYTVTCNAGGFTGTGAASPITVAGLTNGTTYNCSVVATNAVGNSPASAAVAVTPATVPGAPTIGAAAPGNAQASIAFTAPGSNGGSAISGYTVTCNAGGFTGTGAASPITVAGLTNGTTYNCSVVATNAVGNSPASAAVAVTPATVPGAPTIGVATPGNAQASIAFTAPGLTGGSPITGYMVTCSAGGFTGTGAASPITVTGLSNGTTYNCSVVATNAVGSSAASASVAVTPATVPGAPTIGAATPGNAQASIAFSAPGLNGGSAISGYTVTCNAGGFTGTGAATPITVAGLTNGTTYNCSVLATNAVGNGVASATVAVTPVAVSGAPTIGAATPGNAQATIAFTAPALTGGSPITGYTVTCNAGGFTGTGAASPITVTGLTNGTTYNCSVVATNAVGNSAASASVAVTPATVPGVPTIGAATPGNGQASVAFTAPAATGGSAITGYTVTCNVGGFSATGAASPLVVTGLANGTTYNCSVVATNVVGNSAASATVDVTPVAVPGTPTIGAATPGNAQASIAFTAPASTGGSPITGYTATCNAGGFTGTGAASPITVTGLTNGTTYNCSVVATNAAGSGLASAPVAVTPVTVPDAPTIGSATPGNGQASVAFTAPASAGGSPITGYTVTCNAGGFTGTGTASPITVTGLTNGTTYNCSVVATNALGSGAASASVPVTPLVNSYTGPSPTGGGNITASFTGGGAGCSYSTSQFIPLTGNAASPPTGTAPEGVTFPFGLFDFTTGGCTPGATITMTITYPGSIAPTTQYWKYGPTPTDGVPHWYVLPVTLGANSVTFAITDGGLGDDDLVANGRIVDQGGPGVPPVAPALPVPAMSNTTLLLLLLAMLGTAGGALRRSRGGAERGVLCSAGRT